MVNAEELGRKALRLSPEEREQLITTHERRVEAEVNSEKKQCQQKIALKQLKVVQVQKEMVFRGNVPETAAREGFRRALYNAPLLLFCSVGDCGFARWFLSYLSLEKIWTNFIAGMLVIIALEGFDFYLTWLCATYKSYENHFRLTLGSMALLMIFMFIFFTADLRHVVQQITASVNLSTAPEDIVRLSENFYRKSGDSFIWLMTSLGAAFLLVGGATYHETKSCFFISREHLRLHQELRSARNEIERLAEQESAADVKPSRFRAEFLTGLAKEASERAMKREASQAPKEPAPKIVTKRSDRIVPFLFSPPVLMAIALALFLLLFKGRAHGAENIILFDLSKSIGAQNYVKEAEFDKNLKGMEDFIRGHIFAGDAVKALAITEASYSRPYVLLNNQITEDKGQFGEKLAKERMALLESLKKLNLKPVANATDIFGALNLAAAMYTSLGADKRNLIVFSDMRHNTAEINLENQKKVDVEATVAKAVKLGLIPDLGKVKIWCLGVHTIGVTPEYWGSLKGFWTKVFHRSGSQLVAFTMERRFQNE